MVVNPPIPDASVPRELTKVVLPPYVIEPPDLLLVTVLIPPTKLAVEQYKEQTRVIPPPNAPREEQMKSPVSRAFVPQPIDGQHMVGPDGTIKLGVYGSV